MSALVTDISHWSGAIDFDKMQAAGAIACIFKATQGRYVDDSLFKTDWNFAENMVRGAYHYLDWTADADRQAEHFCQVIGSRKLDFPPIVDFECEKIFLTRDMAKSELWTFVTTVERLTKRVPMIYTSPSYWNDFGSDSPVWKKYPLWIANYREGAPVIPAPWTDYVLWQYTGNGPGLDFGCTSKGIDLNRFKGTAAELYQYVGWSTVPSVPEPTDAEKLKILWKDYLDRTK